MDLTKAFGKVNRTLLWTTLYKKGLPIEMINRIRRGHKNTTLAPKLKNKYGKATENNVGAFQGSAISALLFIIYQDDVMEDYDALNRASGNPLKHTEERSRKEIDQQVQNEVRKELDKQSKETKQIFLQQLYLDQHIFPRRKHKNRTELKQQLASEAQELQGTTKIQPTDHQEYADDTILCIQAQITEKSRNN